MRTSDILFRLLVGFSVIILNVTLIPTLNKKMQICLCLVTLGIGVIVAYTGIESMKEGMKK